METLSMNTSAMAAAPLSMLGKALDTTASATAQLLNSAPSTMGSGGDTKAFVNQVMQSQGIGQKLDVEV